MSDIQTINFSLVTLFCILPTAVILIWFYFDRKNNKKAEEERQAYEEKQKQLDAERKRLISTYVKSGEWTKEIARAVYRKEIEIDMDETMVEISWGEPTEKDKIEILKSGSRKERWIYGRKGYGANYISFKDGKVTKIQLKN